MSASWCKHALAAVITLAAGGCAGTTAPEAAAGWNIALDGGCDAQTSEGSAPVVAGGTVYIGSRDGAIYALDAATGRQRWRFQTGGDLRGDSRVTTAPRSASAAEMLGLALEQEKKRTASGVRLITATPAVEHDVAYVGSWDHRMYALNAATGSLKWAFDAGAPIAAAALLHQDLLLFATQGKPGRILALDKRSGREIWAYADAQVKWPHHRLVLHDGVLFVANWDAAAYVKGSALENARTWVRALDASTGKTLWASTLRDAWPSPPTVTSKQVLFMTSPRDLANTTRLRALDKATGRLLWTYEGRGGENYWKGASTPNQSRPPLVARGRFALFASDAYVAGVDVDTGRELWRLAEPFGEKFVNQYDLGPLAYVIAGDTLAPTIGEFFGIDPATGKVAWRRSMPSRNHVQAILDGAVYIRTSLLGATLVEVDGHTGAESATVWRHPLFGNASASICAGPVRHGDLLFVSTKLDEFAGSAPTRGHLYAIKAAGR